MFVVLKRDRQDWPHASRRHCCLCALGGFYDWALSDGWPLNLEHPAPDRCAVWSSGGPCSSTRRRMESLGVLAYLGIGFVTAPWLSLAYIFSSHPFYSFYDHAPRLWGISAAHDQNYAGILMNADQTSVFFIAFAWYLLRVLAEEDRGAAAPRDAAFLATSTTGSRRHLRPTRRNRAWVRQHG